MILSGARWRARGGSPMASETFQLSRRKMPMSSATTAAISTIVSETAATAPLVEAVPTYKVAMTVNRMAYA